MLEEGFLLPDLHGANAFLPRTEQPLKRTLCFVDFRHTTLEPYTAAAPRDSLVFPRTPLEPQALRGPQGPADDEGLPSHRRVLAPLERGLPSSTRNPTAPKPNMSTFWS